jgi:hypothetical protein
VPTEHALTLYKPFSNDLNLSLLLICSLKNLEYARTLLLRLEHSSSSIKIQSRKQSTQADLLKKRELIKRLNERLYEYSQADEDDISDTDDASSGEDLLGEEDRNPSADSTITSKSPPVTSSPLDRRKAPSALEPANTLRSRNHETSQSPNVTSTSTSTSLFPQHPKTTTTATSSALAASSTEQECLTTSLLDLASKLKNSSLSFQSALDSEKSILALATEGLDKNTTNMEAAGKRMGVLRKMSEGRGWLGRMMLYAWIFGLMVVAVLIVFVGPKLRF